jgi:hypothetical protein
MLALRATVTLGSESVNKATSSVKDKGIMRWRDGAGHRDCDG